MNVQVTLSTHKSTMNYNVMPLSNVVSGEVAL